MIVRPRPDNNKDPTTSEYFDDTIVLMAPSTNVPIAIISPIKKPPFGGSFLFYFNYLYQHYASQFHTPCQRIY